MNRSNIVKKLPSAAALSLLVSGLLVACGGGGGGLAETPTTPTSFTAIDGLIKGAIVCVDANNNGQCDTGETQGTTDAMGAVTLKIPTADVGKYPILAVVPAGAIDADDPANPISTGYTLKAPADNPNVITPLTTLVQHLVESGQSSTKAAASIADQTGVTNVYANFVATPDANARTVAKTIVQITQSKLADSTLTAVVGTNDPITGKPITSNDLNTAIRTAIVQLLPSIVSAVGAQAQSGGACVDPTTIACKTAISAAVSGAAGLAASTGVTAANLGTFVGVGKSVTTQVDTATPTAGASLRWLEFVDINNWYHRSTVSTASENTLDANNQYRYRDVRVTKTSGTTTTSGGLINQGRTDDIHWNGSAWVVACSNTWQNTSTARDANGVSAYNFCDGYSKGNSTSVSVDYSGKTIADMVTAIRAYPGSSEGRNFAGWGSADGKATTVLASGFASTAVLPSGSKLRYSTSTTTDAAINYIPSGSGLTQRIASVAAGGDATGAVTPTPACGTSANQTFTTATSLDTVISNNTGTPCKFSNVTVTGAAGATLSSGTLNEWWDATTLFIGTIGTAPTYAVSTSATSYYTGNTILQVGFPNGLASNVANFYACQERYNHSARNCKLIGTGTYATKMLGDAKVLSFEGLPIQATPLTYTRLFVERNGSVRYGFMSKVGRVSSDVRPNLAATNALFNVLGIPAITP